MSAFKHSKYLLLSLFLSGVFSWENLPQLPSGRRSQYYLQHNDGAYKYGFDTGSGFFAKQSADPHNQVEGHFKYPGAHGKDIDIKYTSGIQGYVPSGLEALQAELKAAPLLVPHAVAYSHPHSSASADEASSGDASYSFTIDTDSYKRKESSDSSGNIKGSYSYSNKAGHHDLNYVAGSGTGFVATSGSLSIPNGLGDIGPSGRVGSAGSGSPPNSYSPPPSGDSSSIQSTAGGDGSYSFAYNTGDSSRQESSDSSGNVQGRYSYTNNAGNHDLSYIAGSATGFVATGGSLSVPNGLGDIGPSGRALAGVGSPSGSGSPSQSTGSVPSSIVSSQGPDGSYSFSYNAGDSQREESSDSSGNVKGRYSYNNEAGTHDLSYVAGSETGFVATGGSLSIPNGLGDIGPSGRTAVASPAGYLPPAPPAIHSASLDDSSHDDQSGTGDASYSFTIDTDSYKREESSDASGNIKGRYSFTNSAGNHDLSFVAGSETGFLPTGGSLSVPNGLGDIGPSGRAAAGVIPATGGHSTPSNGGSPSSIDSSAGGDGSYSFSYNAGDSQRQESSDASGNVKGRYSYSNSAGNHDLSYIAGSETGFVATGGSLSVPNGLGDIGPSGRAAAGLAPSASSGGPSSQIDSSAGGDGSYSFSYNTGDSSRQESSDASGNVQGKYSYSNSAGNHDLSYIAGSATGFVATGGSLATPNGLIGKSGGSDSSTLKVNNAYLPPVHTPSVPHAVSGHPKANTYTIGKYVVSSYLPPDNAVKFGYIFDTHH